MYSCFLEHLCSGTYFLSHQKQRPFAVFSSRCLLVTSVEARELCAALVGKAVVVGGNRSNPFPFS